MFSLNRINLHSLRIGFWNANGIRRQLQEVKEFVSDHDLDLFLIQETFLQPGQKSQITNFTLYKNDRVNTNARHIQGGTCIYVKNALTHHQIPTPTLNSSEATMINLKLTNTSSIVLISYYSHPRRFTQIDDLEKLAKIHNNVIFAGDFNATHTSWNNVKSNYKGITLNKFINKKNYTIIAAASATRIDYRATARHNVLDFAIFKNIPFPATATVLHELSSDHLPCILDIETNIKSQSTSNLFVTNWDDYNYNLQHTNLNPINIKNEEDADKAIENFTKDMYAALNNSSSHKYLTKRGRLSNNIKTLIKNKNYIRRLWQRTRDPALKTEFKKLESKIKIRVMDYKNSMWEKHIDALTENQTAFWKEVKRLKNTKNSLPPSDWTTTTWQ
ncbi:RNA-directed DNA polymerase from mobile element jockey [Caerostris extrusa]|uniref:RNA-directed DNA polymerase from mobile element jockey n=1 Tax=Caerostris extrusa TaxID=172846 RepID=A0AAV4UYZ6_CAEEX|nr:RNA-directed DNA polymerase from mobile element jockey [Caerostris extrusa]